MSFSEPRIVLFDLETIADMTEVMKVWPKLSNYPGLTLKASITSIICFGWKLLGQEHSVSCINAWDFPSWAQSINADYELCAAAYEILKDADCVVTHNGKRFDWRFLQTRLLKHGFPPLPRIHHVDTCEVAKRNLFMFSNSLDTVAQFLTDEKKLENGGWDLWVRVSRREPEALALMTAYCKQDIVTLEAVFRKLKPFMTQLPNYNLFTPTGLKTANACPNCGGSRLRRNGYRTTQTRRYCRYLCMDCGTSSRTDAKDEAPRTL